MCVMNWLCYRSQENHCLLCLDHIAGMFYQVARPFIRQELDQISFVILPELVFRYQVVIFQISPVSSPRTTRSLFGYRFGWEIRMCKASTGKAPSPSLGGFVEEELRSSICRTWVEGFRCRLERAVVHQLARF